MPPLVGAAALRVADLAKARQTPAGCPDKRAPPATALLGGALAGSGPGTSPCIDGLSLVTGMVIPQRLTCSNHAHDRLDGTMPATYFVGGVFGRLASEEMKRQAMEGDRWELRSIYSSWRIVLYAPQGCRRDKVTEGGVTRTPSRRLCC
jgi:hypothetical protein